MSEQMHNELNRIWESTEKRLIALNGNVQKTYTFWIYDVWGNDDDGYNVNDRQNIREKIEIDDPNDDTEILNTLFDHGLISESDKDKLVIDNSVSDDENIELVFDENQKPFGQLIIEDDDEITTDIGKFLSEDVLEITREQYQGNNGKWITSSYTLVLGTGGPHTEFNTNGLISVYWGGEKLESSTHDPDAISSIEQIEEWLNETSGE